MKKQHQKIYIYIIFSVVILFIEGFLIGMINVRIPETIEIFGLPFGSSFFIWGITLLVISMIFLWIFPNHTKRGNR